jgi:hypothetical protein
MGAVIGVVAYVVMLGLGFLLFRQVLWSPFIWGMAVRLIGLRTPVAGEVVFVGSSTITYWSSLQHDMAPLAVANCGFGGSMIAHSAYYADILLKPPSPSAVVLSAGSNDLAFGKSVNAVVADFERLVARVHALHPGVPLYFVSINRAPARRWFWKKFDEVNRRVQAIAERDPLVRFIDASSALYDANGYAVSGAFGFDRLHPTAKGYALWTSVIKPRLLADLPDAARLTGAS